MAARKPSLLVSTLIAAILLVGALARYWALDFGLPHTQARPDETYIIDIARAFLSGNLLPPYYDYPWLYMWLLSCVYLGYYVWGVVSGLFHSLPDMIASWPTHWEPFFLLSRALSATFGTATVFVVFRLGRELWDEWTGLLAAWFLSLAFLHARDSHFGTTDVTAAFFITLAVGLLLAAHRSKSQRTFAAAGLVAGLAAATKYHAVLLLAPVVASYALHVAESSSPRRQALKDPRIPVFGLAFLAAFCVGIPFVLFDTQGYVKAMALLWDSMRLGNPALDMGSGYRYHVELSLRHGLGLPLLLTGVAGSILILARERRVAVLLLSFPIAYYVAAGEVRNLFARYSVPLVPFLCLSAAHAVWVSARYIASRWPATAMRERVLTGALGSALGVLIVIPSATKILRFDRLISHTDNRVLVAQWFAAHVPAGCSVAQSGTRYGHVQFDQRRQYREWTWSSARGVFLAGGLPATAPPDWLLVQDSPIPSATQPVVVEWLRKDYSLVRRFKALSSADGLVYDRQDAFFVPFAGFAGNERPGPSFSLFVHAAARHCAARRAGS